MRAMRKAACMVVVMSMLAISGAALLPMNTSASDRAVASWTFMVYLDGDNNLEGYGIDDFLEMASVGSNPQVSIVVQFDRSPLTGWTGGSSEYDDWRSTKRFLVESGDRPTSSYQISDLGEVNMGSQAALQSFLEWGMNSYPANHYALVLWDHGGGWVYGVCSDDTSSGDSLLLPEIRQAITGAQTSTGKTLDLVGFDACLMGMTEVAYEMKDLTDTVVFSEETEPGQGWAYDKILASLVASPTMTSDQLGGVIVRE
ncbi:MAG: clostripain-related cysteine peptidase, partial [Methanomassiliicoccales archaeon]|nr:clostripain-related cysteine peptidase [Methanomassiliicoccales archaeon]